MFTSHRWTEWHSASVDRIDKTVLMGAVSLSPPSLRDVCLDLKHTSELCTACNPSNNLWKVGLNLSYRAVWLVKMVSPPVSGVLISRSIVYAGGLASKE